ncbi:lipase family protein [Roseateles sp. NT4]|uniref:lipase family protein n=1 Tax=Roseateles sp. NT4 TaxID=3453715 RepID=UPI003EEE893F
MPTISYDSSRKALLQPESRGTLLTDGFRVEDEAREVQFAIEAARLSYYRYDEDADEGRRLSQALALAGFGAPTCFQHAGSDGQGFGAVDAKGLGVLAFRGTQPDRICDLVTDAHVLLVPWNLDGTSRGEVHVGFKNTALGMWAQVKPWLDATKPKKLIICGHSLGAAIATLLAVPARASRLVTIGSPRVGNAEFTAHVGSAGVQNTRIVDCCDLVTQIPPPAFDFHHLDGGFEYIDRSGVRHSAPAQALMDDDRQAGRAIYLAQYAFRFGTVLTRDLADHAPINYLRAYWS